VVSDQWPVTSGQSGSVNIHSDEIVIRLADLDDAEIIAYQRRAMFADMKGQQPDDFEAMDVTFVPYVQRALADGTYRGWLACTSDRRVVAGGGLIVHEWPARPPDYDPHRAYILNMYTEPTHRHRGIARRIVTTMLGWCRQRGFTRVYLHASHYGRPLYESLGFEPTTEMRLKLSKPAEDEQMAEVR
jgi:GNAT superfamily N-acetyltransferase